MGGGGVYMDKKTYYVNIATGEISQIPYQNNTDFTINANKEDVRMLRAKMDNMEDASLRSFVRAHVPIVPYHHDQSNADYDASMTEALQMIHQLGDEETRIHIESMGVLSNRPL